MLRVRLVQTSVINSIRVAREESAVRAQTNRSTPVIWTTLGAVRAIASDLAAVPDLTLNGERDPCSFFCLLFSCTNLLPDSAVH